MFSQRNTIIFCLAAKADTKEIVKFINEVFSEKDKSIDPKISYRKEGEAGNRTNEAEISEKISSPSCYLYVAVDTSRPADNRIVGTRCMNLKRPSLLGEDKSSPFHEELCRGELTLFAIHRDYRSKNLGKLFTNHIETKAKELGVTELFLEVVGQQGSLIEHNKKAGFFLTGTLDTLVSERFKNDEITLIQMIKKVK